MCRLFGRFANRLFDIGAVRAIFRYMKRTPPNLVDTVVGFNETASAMVATRWKQLTFTNLLAQLSPLLVVIAALWFNVTR